MALNKLPRWFPAHEDVLQIRRANEKSWYALTVNQVIFDLTGEPIITFIDDSEMLSFDRKGQCWKIRDESLAETGERVFVKRGKASRLPKLDELDLINPELFPKKGDVVRVTLMNEDIFEAVKSVEIDRRAGTYSAELVGSVWIDFSGGQWRCRFGYSQPWQMKPPVLCERNMEPETMPVLFP